MASNLNLVTLGQELCYHTHHHLRNLILRLFRFRDVCTLFENLTIGDYECSDCISGKKQDLETCMCDQKEGECLFNNDNFITWAHSESELDCFLVCSAMKDCKYYNWFSSENEEIHQQCLLLSSCDSVDSCTSGTYILLNLLWNVVLSKKLLYNFILFKPVQLKIKYFTGSNKQPF